MHELPPTDHPPHLPAAQAVAGGSPLFAALIDGRISLVGRFETVDGFREACKLYASRGYFVGITRKAVAGLIAQAKRRAAA